MMMTYIRVAKICQKVHKNTYFMQREKTVGATREINTLKDREEMILMPNILTVTQTLCMSDMGRTLVHQLIQGIGRNIMLKDQILEGNMCPKDLTDMVMKGISVGIIKAIGTIMEEGGILDLARKQVFRGITESGGERQIINQSEKELAERKR